MANKAYCRMSLSLVQRKSCPYCLISVVILKNVLPAFQRVCATARRALPCPSLALTHDMRLGLGRPRVVSHHVDVNAFRASWWQTPEHTFTLTSLQMPGRTSLMMYKCCTSEYRPQNKRSRQKAHMVQQHSIHSSIATHSSSNA